MIHSKCRICGKGSGFIDCCGYDKRTGKKIVTIWDYIKKLFIK